MRDQGHQGQPRPLLIDYHHLFVIQTSLDVLDTHNYWRKQDIRLDILRLEIVQEVSMQMDAASIPAQQQLD